MSKVSAGEMAKKAEKKSSVIGPDIDLNAYSAEVKEHGKIQRLKDLSGEVKEKAISVGVDAEEACRSGSFFQMDHSVILSSAYQNGMEVMSSTEALKKYDWLSDYWWKAVNVDADKYT
ncbi:MAG: SufD family Fe-S cluster assembly protein, partial [Candidatus Methanoperedens sp.]|nr:SufD family Fe-S cluster assembly protein [Candidatus Methanoperedens sp.]